MEKNLALEIWPHCWWWPFKVSPLVISMLQMPFRGFSCIPAPRFSLHQPITTPHCISSKTHLQPCSVTRLSGRFPSSSSPVFFLSVTLGDRFHRMTEVTGSFNALPSNLWQKAGFFFVVQTFLSITDASEHVPVKLVR
jgi:hypothetical protein